MIFQRNSFLAFASSLLVASSLSFSNVALAQSFEEINEGYDQSATGIYVAPKCSSSERVPKTMYTIEPGDSVSVSTNPPNLLTVSSDASGTLQIEWNEEVAKSSSSGGVKITFPASQLRSIDVDYRTTVQIMDGFTAVNDLKVNGQSTVKGTFAALGVQALDFSIDGQSTVNVQSNVPVSANVNGQSTVTVGAPSVSIEKVDGQSTFNVDGDISGGNTINGQSTVTASGSVTGAVNWGWGSVTIDGQSSLNVAGGCDNVATSGQSSCNPGTPSVTVDTSEQDAVMNQGTKQCWGGIFGSGGSVGTHSPQAAAAAATMAATAVGIVALVF